MNCGTNKKMKDIIYNIASNFNEMEVPNDVKTISSEKTSSSEKLNTTRKKKGELFQEYLSMYKVITYFLYSKLVVLSQQKYVQSAKIFGGFVRDGEKWYKRNIGIDLYRKFGKDTDETYSDIDINIILQSNLINLSRNQVVENILSVFPIIFHAPEITIEESSKCVKSYDIDQHTFVIKYKEIAVSIDVVIQESLMKLDFDVNAFFLDPIHGKMLNTRGIRDLYYYQIEENISRQVFHVMWSNIEHANLKKIVERVHKMENRGWTCLNFNNGLSKVPDSVQHFFKCYAKAGEKNRCVICQYDINVGSFIPTILKCQHNENYHHRCLLLYFLTNPKHLKCEICKKEI